MKSFKPVYLLLVIVLLGALLRLYALGEASFVADEFLDINSSYAYAKTGVWQSWDFNLGKVNTDNVFAPRDERAWVYKWQVAQVLRHFPPTESVARSVSVAWGIASIVLMYFVGKYFAKRKAVGLISAALFAVSISAIIFDRRLRMYAMFFPVFLLFSWMTYRFYEEPYVGKLSWIKKIWKKTGVNLVYLPLAIASGILSLLVHDLTVSMAAIFGSYVLVMAITSYRDEKTLKNKYVATLILIASGGLAAFTLFASQIGKYAAGIKFFNDNYSYFSIIFTDYAIVSMALIFLVLGAWGFLKGRDMFKQGLWLTASFLVPLLMGVLLWRRNAGPQYIFFAQSFQIILIASGIHYVANFFADNMSKRGKMRVYVSTVAVSLLLLPNVAYFFQENTVYRQNAKAENPNYRSIFTYFKKKRGSEDVLVTRNFRNYYWSGERVKVFDFGGELAEEKFSLADLAKIVDANNSGWVILSSNDDRYVANDAMRYMEDAMEKVNDLAVRGNVVVYRWAR